MKKPEYPFYDTRLSMKERIENLLSLLDVKEKINFLFTNSPPLPRLGIKKYNHGNECLHGLIRPGRATVFPQAIAFGATWDPELIYKVANAISDEARAKHHAVEEYMGLNNGLLTFWSPTVNMARDPRWGRTPETYGEDPHLTQRIGVNFVRGLQGNDPKYIKVISTPKHFVGNNQEFERSKLKPEIPEKWLRDYYLKGFKACIIEAKAESIMGAYNALFNIPCNQNKFLLTDLLRGEWGFEGYVVTDCGAIENALPNQHDIAETPAQAAAMSINAGVDLECGHIYPRGGLYEAFKEGLVSEDRIEFAVSNVLRGRMKVGFFDPDEDNPYSNIPINVVGCKKHSDLALRTAEKSIVLLKNSPTGENNESLLPLNLNKIKSIAVVGPNSDVAQFGDYTGMPFNPPITPLEGLSTKIKDTDIELNHVSWISHKASQQFMLVPPKNLRPTEDCDKKFGLVREFYSEPNFEGNKTISHDEIIEFKFRYQIPDASISNAQTDSNEGMMEELQEGKRFSVKWKGFIKPDVSGKYKCKIKNKFGKRPKPKVSINNSDFKVSLTIQLEAGKKYPIEIQMPNGYLGSYIGFEWKLPSYHESESDFNFTREIEAAKNSDIVLAFLGLALDDECEGTDRKDFKISKQQSEMIRTLHEINPNIVVILIAGSNLAINWMAEHVPAILHAWYPGERGGDAIANVLLGDYNPAGRLPLTFYTGIDQIPSFSNYDLSKGHTYWFLKTEPIFPFGHGLSYTTFEYSDLIVENSQVREDEEIKLKFKVFNCGEPDGEEVVQLYVSYREKTREIPIKQLKAFKRISIKSGEKAELELCFNIRDLAFWNLDTKQFEVQKGLIELQIGSSSRDIRLTREIEII